MSCYHPLVGRFDGEYFESGKKKYHFFGNLDVESKGPLDIVVPCGHCLGCRLDYSRRWADRMMLELAESDGAIFLTLTYDKDHLVDFLGNPLPSDQIYGSLYKRHLQLFMKSFRKELAKSGKTVRFFASGEYGSWSNTHRPHYHIILFGVGLDFFEDKKQVGSNELGQVLFTSPFISRCWRHGFISFGAVSWHSCAYVARYVTKKALNPETDILNEMLQLNPEFSLMSRRPGLGKAYLDSHPDCLDFTSVFLTDQDGSKKVSIPKYFVNQLKLTDPDRYDSIVADRKRFANDRLLSELSQSDLGSVEYFVNKERDVERRIKSLKREL